MVSLPRLERKKRLQRTYRLGRPAGQAGCVLRFSWTASHLTRAIGCAKKPTSGVKKLPIFRTTRSSDLRARQRNSMWTMMQVKPQLLMEVEPQLRTPDEQIARARHTAMQVAPHKAPW